MFQEQLILLDKATEMRACDADETMSIHKT